MRIKEVIDLTIPVQNSNYTGFQPDMKYMDHAEGARFLGKALGLAQSDFPDGMGLAWEEYHGITHMATHLDAPWHFGPTVGGKPAKTIDQIDLKICISDGVRLDMRHLGKGDVITVDHVKEALSKIGYTIKPLDIVLIWTDSDKLKDDPRYRKDQQESQQCWTEQNRDYWQRYRDQHPEYVEQNRLLQRERDQRRRSDNLAKMDALNQKSHVKALSYYLIPGTGDLAKMDALSPKYLLIPIG